MITIFLVSTNDFWLLSKNLRKLKRNVLVDLFDYHQCYLKSFTECLYVKFYPGMRLLCPYLVNCLLFNELFIRRIPSGDKEKRHVNISFQTEIVQ